MLADRPRRFVQLTRSDDRRANQARHSRTERGIDCDVRQCGRLLENGRFPGDILVRAARRRGGGFGSTGESDFYARAGAFVPYVHCRGRRRARPRQRLRQRSPQSRPGHIAGINGSLSVASYRSADGCELPPERDEDPRRTDWIHDSVHCPEQRFGPDRSRDRVQALQ